MFEVGDNVRVKENANLLGDKRIFFAPEMKECLGKEYKIRSICEDDIYTLKGVATSTKYYWRFSEKWLEPADSIEINIKEDDFEELLCLK